MKARRVPKKNNQKPRKHTETPWHCSELRGTCITALTVLPVILSYPLDTLPAPLGKQANERASEHRPSLHPDLGIWWAGTGSTSTCDCTAQKA